MLMSAFFTGGGQAEPPVPVWYHLVAGIALLMASVLALGWPAAAAQIDPRSIVYIECTSADGTKTSHGSGVIVQEDGRVLTSKHVAPDGYTCKGGLGTAATTPNRKLIRRKVSAQFDAMLFQFVPDVNERFIPINYVRVKQSMAGAELRVFGYFGNTGQIVQRDGVLSTTVPDSDGLFQTDALTARSMSGGAVVLAKNSGLVGIVAGAHYDPLTGEPTDYAVLSAELIATELDLTADVDGNAAESDRNQKEEQPFEGIRVLYFEKDADEGRVERVLDRLKIGFEKGQSENDLPTTLLTCTTDIPVDKIKLIALGLLDEGQPLKMINVAIAAVHASHRISLEGDSGLVDNTTLTKPEIESLDRCRFLESSKDVEKEKAATQAAKKKDQESCSRTCQLSHQSCKTEKSSALDDCHNTAYRRCMKSCTGYYGNPYSECKSNYCAPERNVDFFDSKCDTEHEELRACEADFRSCLSSCN